MPSGLNTGLARSPRDRKPPGRQFGRGYWPPRGQVDAFQGAGAWAGRAAQPCRLTSRTWPAAPSGEPPPRRRSTAPVPGSRSSTAAAGPPVGEGHHHQASRRVRDRDGVRFERGRAAPGPRAEHPGEHGTGSVGHRQRKVRAAGQGIRSDADAVRGASHDPVDPHGCSGTKARRVEGVGGARPGDHAGDLPAVAWQPRQRPGDGAAEGDLPQPRATDQHPAVDMGVLPGQVDLRQVDGRSARPRGRGPHGRRPRRRRARPGNRRCGGRRRPRRRGRGTVVGPSAGDYHADQHRPRGNSGDRPHPPRWPGPATELVNPLMALHTLAPIVSGGKRSIIYAGGWPSPVNVSPAGQPTPAPPRLLREAARRVRNPCLGLPCVQGPPS